MIHLIKELTNTFGVSGSENKIRALIESKVKGKVDNIYTDALGNLICVKKGGGEKVMLAAHMDEIGIIATFVDDNGFIRFSRVGGVSPFYALGQRVLFENGTFGVVYYEEKLDSMKDLNASSMYIDIGASSKEEALKKVKIGETAGFYSESVQEGDYLISKGMDNRSGVAVLLEVIHALPKTDKEIYFVFTVQEEVGLRGAKTAAFGLMPDIAIAVDVTRTGDTPNCRPMEVFLGKGPAIKIKDSSVLCHKDVIARLRKVCEEDSIPYQNEILEAGGTDAGAIHLTGGGIPSGAVSIPCRYIHTPNEMVHQKDLENAVRLLVGILKK
jgi:tetrahedral aminopeptidase